VGLGAVLLSGLLGGRRGTVSAVLGLAVVLLFFVLSLYLVEVANRVAPSLTLPVAVTVYSTLVLWLIVLAGGTNLPEHLHQGAFAWTVIASTLGWLVLQSIAVWRRRAPYVEVELPTASDRSDGPRA
jgi:ATP synthase protein I